MCFTRLLRNLSCMSTTGIDVPFVKQLGERLWEVNYPTTASMTASATESLVEPLAEATKAAGRLMLVGVVPPELRLVPPAVITLWLSNLTRGNIRVSALVVVTTSMAVRAALAGLAAAMKVSNQPIAFANFPTREAAVGWAKEQLAK